MSDFPEGQRPETPIDRVDQAPHQSAAEGDLGAEFKEFGRQLLRAVRSVAESEELRRLGHEITESLKDIGEEVQQTLEQTRSRDDVKAVGEQARRVTQALAPKDVAGEVQSGLSQALRSLNSELNKVIDQIQSRTARVSDEVDSTARAAAESAEQAADDAADKAADVADSASEQRERFEEAMDEALDEAAEDSAKGPGAIEDEPDTLPEAWQEPSQPEGDNTTL